MANKFIEYLMTEISESKVITKKTSFNSLLKLIGGNRNKDIIFHIARQIMERKYINSLIECKNAEQIIITGTVLRHLQNTHRKSPYKVELINSYNEVFHITFFRAYPQYIRKTLPINQEVAISGKADFYQNQLNIVHPEYVVPLKKIDDIPTLETIYPLSFGITQPLIRSCIQEKLKDLPQALEWLSQKTLDKFKFHNWNDSIKLLHTPPPNHKDLTQSIYRKRLAYDELLAYQISLLLLRGNNQRLGVSIQGDQRLVQKLRENLPFQLTKCQELAIEDIFKDQALPEPMLRLLQGDVGCGKTIVAIFAILNALECSTQVAFMAPTSLLANQHYQESISILANILDIDQEIILLTSKDKGKKRKEKIKLIQEGITKIIIGTHSLFQQDISFHNLSLIIIDEQHRFGVDQRNALASKGKNLDILLMSATPIPRTLSMALYSDIKISRITSKPQNRQKIITSLLHQDRIDELIIAIQRALTKNEKIYWICPLIEESEQQQDRVSIEERFQILSQFFPKDILSIIHGKMSEKDKDIELEKFLEGSVKILIATTVIEVGINVPDATIMIIENANIFGLAQLHQLRGRVGRGDKPGYCILIYSSQSTTKSRERLKILKDSNDGFLIAEKDLEIRGSGDLLGTKQSGVPNFKFLDLTEDSELIQPCIKESKEIISLYNNNSLPTIKEERLNLLMALFEYQTL